jgi:hypothetical protein
MSRFVDRGAITAAWVGVGMAVTIGVSFLLVIPIEFLVTPFALFAGLMIGYYANARSNRAGGPWLRIMSNALLAGIATGVTFALLLLLVKVIFFFADTGYPDFNRADANGNKIPPFCQSGADCVYQRYLAIGRGPAFVAAGVTDVDSFTALYWREQFASGGALIVLSVAGALGGGVMYGLANRRRPDERPEDQAAHTPARPA